MTEARLEKTSETIDKRHLPKISIQNNSRKRNVETISRVVIMLATVAETPIINESTIPAINNIRTDKVKPPAPFVNDAEGFRQRAACVCVRNRDEQEVLLVSSARKSGWIIPGGKVEPEEAGYPAVAAVREAMEEAGVVGTLGRCLGTFENSERQHRTRVFVLYVDELKDVWQESADNGPEGRKGRTRQWFTLPEAQSLLRENKPIHSKYIEALRQTRALHLDNRRS